MHFKVYRFAHPKHQINLTLNNLHSTPTIFIYQIKFRYLFDYDFVKETEQ